MLVIYELPVTVHVRPPVGTDLADLRDKFARAKVSFLHSMLRKAPRSVFVILLLLSLDAVAQQWSSWSGVPEGPTTSHNLLLFLVTRMWDGAQLE